MSDKKNFYDHVSGSTISVGLEKTQINKFHTKGGTGFAAEEANAAADRWAGGRVEQVGTSNKLNGADRIVNGVQIQTKYFSSASATLRAALDDQGQYRYGNQMLEVPSDQYDEVLRLMRQKILDGAVPGVTDPAQAESIVKKGQVSYRQARNIARPGNVDSLVFDAQTQAVTTGYAFALSFVISFAKSKWEGRDYKEAIGDSLATALQSGATSCITGIATSQILRTRAAAVGVVFMRDGVKAVASTNLGKSAVQKVAEVSLGKAVYGVAATNHVAKLLRTNTVTSVVTTVVTSAPDLYRAAFQGSISWAQFCKNLTVNGLGVAAGTGGWMAGAAAGAAIGSAAFPGPGTAVGGFVGGLAGSLAGGAAASSASKYALDALIEDDAKEMLALLPEYLQLLAEDYLLSEAETKALIQRLQERITAKFLRDMYKSVDRPAFVYATFEPICEEIAAQRPPVEVPKPQDVQAELDAIEKRTEESLDDDALEGQQVVTSTDHAVQPAVVVREWLHREDYDLDFLKKLRSEELDVLVRILTHDDDGRTRRTESLTNHTLYKAHYPDHRHYWDLVAAEVQSFGANAIATLVRRGKGVPYREVLTDVCARLSVEHDKDGVTEAIERALLAKLVDDLLSKTSEDELVRIGKELGVTGVQALHGPALAAALMAAFEAGGFISQRLVVIMMTSILKHVLGRGLQVAGVGAVMPTVGAWIGPAGWVLTGAWAAFDLAGPAYRVTVPAVLQIAALRRQYLMELRGEMSK